MAIQQNQESNWVTNYIEEEDLMPGTIDLRDKLPWHPTKRWKKRSKIDLIVLHTTASDNQDPFKTNQYHITSNALSKGGAPRLAYHDFITKNGTIYHCNNYDDWTWHAGLVNKRSIGIVMAYKGQDNIFPEMAQYRSAIKLTCKLCLYLGLVPDLTHVKGHREIPGMYTILGNGSKKYKKECPGQAVNLIKFRSNVAIEMQVILKDNHYYRDTIDGFFGPLSIKALDEYTNNLKMSILAKKI